MRRFWVWFQCLAVCLQISALWENGKTVQSRFHTCTPEDFWRIRSGASHLSVHTCIKESTQMSTYHLCLQMLTTGFVAGAKRHHCSYVYCHKRSHLFISLFRRDPVVVVKISLLFFFFRYLYSSSHTTIIRTLPDPSNFLHLWNSGVKRICSNQPRRRALCPSSSAHNVKLATQNPGVSAG